MKTLVMLLSVPFLMFSRFAEALDLWNLRSDLARCLRVVDTCVAQYTLPNRLLKALVVAEDRRNALHFGVDPIGMIRAAVSFVTRNGIQGASTIEQQFVRVVTKRYQRTLSRKIKEQALAIALSRRRTKKQISTAYLRVAFYGHDLVGAQGLARLCGASLRSSSLQNICGAIARLKYPEPLRPSVHWKQRLSQRTAYIAALLQESSGRLEPTRVLPRALVSTNYALAVSAVTERLSRTHNMCTTAVRLKSIRTLQRRPEELSRTSSIPVWGFWLILWPNTPVRQIASNILLRRHAVNGNQI